jgi:hypothetical protein
VRLQLTLAAAVAAAVTIAPASFAEAGAAAPRVALSVSPARVALVAPASSTIDVRNVGADSVTVAAVRRAVDRRAAVDWLTITPSRLVLAPGSHALLTLRARAHGQALAGDHRLLALLIAEPLQPGRVAVRLRLGVAVRVRVPGVLFRRTEVGPLQVHRQRGARVLAVALANRGNVTEELRSPATVTLVRRRGVVARLPARVPRELLPGGRAVIRARYGGRVRGPVTAVVRVRFAGGRTPILRRYEVRL